MKNSMKKYFYISSLEKGFKVLELLAEKEGLTVTKVAELLGFNRAGSHRYLSTLRELGYLEKNADSRYQLTFKLLEIGMKFANRFEIRRVARPFMEELLSIFNETVNLGYWDGKIVVHLDKTESQEILRLDLGIGMRAPAYCTGLGKAILAFLPVEERKGFFQRVKFLPYTPNTITTKEKLLEELQKTRERGFAIDDEELAIGLRCVAAPVFDYKGFPAHAISIAGPTVRMTHNTIARMEKDLRRICAKLSSFLGEPGHEEKYVHFAE